MRAAHSNNQSCLLLRCDECTLFPTRLAFSLDFVGSFCTNHDFSAEVAEDQPCPSWIEGEANPDAMMASGIRRRHECYACQSRRLALVHREIVVVEPYVTARLIALILIKGTEDDAEPWDGRM
ncbi:hypothetical protein BRAS3843_730007 [Bradyrhizobium sp. STM 3843]|nr:hypothetical protein BRAS3843_730007 [Bradyrhizobium sp. STM 3843]